MALDTRDKRASAVHVSLPWRGVLPAPDGSVGGADRQQSAFLYRGVAAGGGGAAPAANEWIVRARRRGRR